MCIYILLQTNRENAEKCERKTVAVQREFSLISLENSFDPFTWTCLNKIKFAVRLQGELPSKYESASRQISKSMKKKLKFLYSKQGVSLMLWNGKVSRSNHRVIDCKAQWVKSSSDLRNAIKIHSSTVVLQTIELRLRLFYLWTNRIEIKFPSCSLWLLSEVIFKLDIWFYKNKKQIPSRKMSKCCFTLIFLPASNLKQTLKASENFDSFKKAKLFDHLFLFNFLQSFKNVRVKIWI